MIYDFFITAFGFFVFFGLIFLVLDMLRSVALRFFDDSDYDYGSSDDDSDFDSFDD